MTKNIDLLRKKRVEIDIKLAEAEKPKTIIKKGSLKFFEFCQNNTGGSFITDKNLCHRLFIEAHNYEEAREKALELGVYFDGCETGEDCNCCGDRWYDHDYDKGMSLVKLRKDYKKSFKTIYSYVKYLADEYGWTKPDARIFYYNRKVKEVFSKKVK